MTQEAETPYEENYEFPEEDIEEIFPEEEEIEEIFPEEEDFGALFDELSTPAPSLDEYQLKLSHLEEKVTMFNTLLPNFKKSATMNQSGEISISIPTDFLPTSLQVVYGFRGYDTILELQFELDISFNWKEKYSELRFEHPKYKNIYSGKALIQKAIDNFFTQEYKPKALYRSAPFLFGGPTRPDPEKVQILIDKGFSKMQAANALSLLDNNIDNCAEFLQTGQYYHETPIKPPIRYIECPLLYLVLEICDAILDLQDHCCICGKPMPAGLRPTICSSEACMFSFAEVGVGTTVTREIRRDPQVADLLLSVFAAALGTEFLHPAPPFINESNQRDIADQIAKMPNMKVLSAVDKDRDLQKLIGDDCMKLLQWILLTNRSHFFYLPESLQYREFNSGHKCSQFLTMISSPEAENIFLQLKQRYGGSYFLWHGSVSDRWHSIIRNGLKNYSNTKYMRVGNACGDGIYFAPQSSTSLGYVQSVNNPYLQSQFPQLHIIALCEVAKLPFDKNQTVQVDVMDQATGKTVKKTLHGALNNHGWAYTLTMEEACIVRFLLVGLSGNVDVMANPPRGLPTLNDILSTFVPVDISS